MVAPYVGAWVETMGVERNRQPHPVAPYVGAWVETLQGYGVRKNMLSHLTWVRGLKPANKFIAISTTLVAPYVGAWVETCLESFPKQRLAVAPYVGAWVETI